MHINPVSRSRMGRIAWSWFRHPMKSREFPAKHERLVTAEELMRFRSVATAARASTVAHQRLLSFT